MDNVSMGTSLGPIIANIFMTELENIVTKKFMDNTTTKYY